MDEKLENEKKMKFRNREKFMKIFDSEKSVCQK